VPEFISPLSREACVQTLKKSVDSYWMLFGSRPVQGNVWPGGFGLTKRIWWRNSFQTQLSGQFEEVSGGTRVRFRAGMSLFTIAFIAVWFFLVLTIGGSISVAYFGDWLARGAPLDRPPAAALFPLGMVAFGAALVLFGRLAAYGEGAYLADFVRRKLGVRAACDE
jgi:hypothetical protein